jgi:hypothetical protein
MRKFSGFLPKAATTLGRPCSSPPLGFSLAEGGVRILFYLQCPVSPGYGQVLLAGGHLVILGGSGELARFPAQHGRTWNYPAIADGKIFVRNAVEMACFDLNH